MKSHELIEGEFYITDIKNPGYLFKSIDDNSCSPHINPSKTNYYKGGSLVNNSFSDYRLATLLEKAHLNACISAGKYVDCPKEELINEYPIYN